MTSSHRFSITIGIPAHNEEQNVANLLHSIYAQSSANFTIKQVIVACDGCTDKTAQVVRFFSRTHKAVRVIDDGKWLGKRRRLMQICNQAEGNIFINLDADSILGSQDTLDHLVSPFSDPQVGFVSGNALPVSPTTFTEKVLFAWEMVWYLARIGFKDGQNVLNTSSCIWGASLDLIRRVNFPSGIISDATVLYFSVLELGKKPFFSKSAVSYFRLPSTLSDYQLVLNRYPDQRHLIIKRFGDTAVKAYMLPKRYKTKAFLQRLIANPFFTLLGTILYTWLMIVNRNQPLTLNSKGIWEPITSTKRSIGLSLN